MGTTLHRNSLFLFTLWAMGLGLVFPAAGSPGIKASVVGDSQTVFRWRTDRCGKNHIPDAPARAFRDVDDVVHLIAAHQINRAMVGPHLGRTRVDCAVVF
ncbi:MAG: hypothetical protein O3A51_09910, partial [Verrucomicrobia bacterium]|nr:hypothetical protein [Verrucomicrobiota bacterium]